MDISGEETKILDMNDLVAKRIEALKATMSNPENVGFVAGIPADNVEVGELLSESEEDALFADNGDGEGAEGPVSGNVIKARREEQVSQMPAQPAVDTEEIKRQAEEAAQSVPP